MARPDPSIKYLNCLIYAGAVHVLQKENSQRNRPGPLVGAIHPSGKNPIIQILCLGRRRFISLAQKISGNIGRYCIKDIHHDISRSYQEGHFLSKVQANKSTHGLARGAACGYPALSERGLIETTHCVPDLIRQKPRLLHSSELLLNCELVDGFLCIAYDCISAQPSLLKRGILHRDISVNSILINLDGAASDDRTSGRYPDTKNINQALVFERHPPKIQARCLLTDLENRDGIGVMEGDTNMLAALLDGSVEGVRDNKDSHDARPSEPSPDDSTQRTGIPVFIAISAARNRHSDRRYRLMYEPMPHLHGGALAKYEKLYGQRTYDRYSDKFLALHLPAPPKPFPALVQRPYHDAESIFWVMAWFLARALPSNADPQSTTDFRAFCRSMSTHQIQWGGLDMRIGLRALPADEWRRVLHPDLQFLSQMVSTIDHYLFPEWGHRSVADEHADHVYEAMQRALFAELFEMDVSGETVPLSGRRPFHRTVSIK
ncbi:hypothetical protein BOTBODRAFT_181597 [Botryobasidium botryosum FD-172 SS1]|uniref:Fungal-type protein kinase domain-containing protein n=1 Tax=Botryobasidium botryosum (strain FD-172 SS1) TaxID=930990 RepID=A0A067M3J8_BOTB1|nr:hypothetical protein BOTBODRAFT_181597 [Botryobasidium botryosum FD-172 SS1]